MFALYETYVLELILFRFWQGFSIEIKTTALRVGFARRSFAKPKENGNFMKSPNKHNDKPDVSSVKKATTKSSRKKKLYAEGDGVFYKLIFEKSTAPTIVVEEDYTISKINERHEELLGYSKEEVEGKIKWTSLVTAEDLEMMKQYHKLRRINPDAAPKEYECHFIGRAGEIYDIQIKMDMIPGTTTSVATLVNITEKKIAETKLRQRESELRTIVENFPGYIYTSRVDYSLEFMNRMLLEKVGEGQIGQKCYTVLFGLKTPCPWCDYKRVFNGEITRSEFYDPNVFRWYDMVSTPIFDAKGKVHKLQTILIDITEKKLAEEKLKTSATLLQEENVRLKLTMKDRYRFGKIVGKSSKMQAVYELILRASMSNSSVIIYGESGTGKEMVANEIHRLSNRNKNPFVPVNCGAIPENLMESEFFGYKKGAFTGAVSDKKGYLELAEGGTLFLDELGEIALPMQVKLLRAIDGGGFIPLGGKTIKNPDIKIIGATNQNLLEMINQGKMRDDFFYRIHIIPIRLPPLRKRKSDIPLLLEHFVKLDHRDSPFPEIESSVIEAFMKYHWPGNVRELQNALNRYLTLGTVDFIHNANLNPTSQTDSILSGSSPIIPNQQLSLKSAMADVEKQFIQQKLAENKWHRGKTAQVLGINRRTLERRMAMYQLNDND